MTRNIENEAKTNIGAIHLLEKPCSVQHHAEAVSEANRANVRTNEGCAKPVLAEERRVAREGLEDLAVYAIVHDLDAAVSGNLP